VLKAARSGDRVETSHMMSSVGSGALCGGTGIRFEVEHDGDDIVLEIAPGEASDSMRTALEP
jgi:hypothetical protein